MASAASAATFVYVGNTDSNEIIVLRLDPQSGELAPVERVTIPGVTKPGNSTPMAVSPDRKFLYAGTRGEPQIAAGFAIDPTRGTLKHVASGPLADSMAYIAVDRTGRYLLGASTRATRSPLSAISPAGTVLAPQQVLEGHPNAHSILSDAANRFVLVPRSATISSTCSPSTPPLASSRRARRRDSRRRPVRATSGSIRTQARLRARRAGRRGLRLRLRRLHRPAQAKAAHQRAPGGLPGQASAADIHMTPDGKFLYAVGAADEHPRRVQDRSASGALTSIGSVPTEKQPRAFAIDSSGRYLLAVGQLSHALSTYRIDPSSGALTKLKEYPMGKNPNWIEIVDLP
jgi:6-phosphogluconolactonase